MMKNIGERFSAEKIKNQKYDAIVIGSGIGSLATAVLLAEAGKKVCVLEQHYTIGGFTQSFKRRNYEWDVGVHYVGQVLNERSSTYKLFKRVTDTSLQWASVGEIYDIAIFPDERFAFRQGRQLLRQDLIAQFPREIAGIERYFHLVRQVIKTSDLYFASKLLPPFLAQFLGPLLRRPFKKYSMRTVKEVLDDTIQDQKLKAILATQWGDYGLPPCRASFAIHAMVANHYFEGAAYPVGGAGSIARAMAPLIRNAGGELFVRAAVKQVIIENERAVGVTMKDGSELRASIIISGAGVYTTYQKLLPPHLGFRPLLAKQLEEVRPAMSHLCLYLGLKKSASELGLQKANQWIFPSYDHDRNVEKFMTNASEDFPVVYISFPSAKDPSWEERYPGRATIDVVTLAPHGMFAPWQDTRWSGRGEEYLALKNQLKERLLSIVLQHNPRVKAEDIECWELSTPLSTKHFCGYEHGEIYGLDHDPRRFEQNWLRPKTSLSAFYLTGQDVATAGVSGALAAGVMTAAVILKRNFFR